MNEATTTASSTEAARLAALAGMADEARNAVETPAGSASSEAPDAIGEAGEHAIKAQQVERAATFVPKIVAKTGNRFLPGLFEEEDRKELTALLQPVMVKHETVILAWIEKWFDEAMLGIFLIDKAADAIDLVRQRIEDKKQHGKAAQQKTPGEKPAAPTGGFVAIDPNSGAPA